MANERTEANLDLQFYDSYKHTASLIAKSTFFYIQNAGHFGCAADYYTRREGLQSILLLYTIKGKGYASYRGKHYEINKNQLLFIDCEDYQEYYTDKQDLWEMKWVHFHGCGSDGYFKMIYDNYGPVVHLPENSLIPHYIDEMIQLIKNADRQLEVKASCLIMQMLTEIILAGSQHHDQLTGYLHHSQVETALEFIAQNYAVNISVKDIANTANSSIFHFIRLFKKATGYSPYEYLIKYRINKAKSLLSSTLESVEQISEKIGFDSTSNFIKTFKQIEGITPLRYRKFWMNEG
jgi:AraC-like DNA-binding protein